VPRFAVTRDGQRCLIPAREGEAAHARHRGDQLDVGHPAMTVSWQVAEKGGLEPFPPKQVHEHGTSRGQAEKGTCPSATFQDYHK